MPVTALGTARKRANRGGGGGSYREEEEQLSADMAAAMRLSQDEEEERQLQAALRSQQDEAAGWNALVQPLLAHTRWQVSPDNASVLTLSVPQVALYDITKPELLELAEIGRAHV